MEFANKAGEAHAAARKDKAPTWGPRCNLFRGTSRWSVRLTHRGNIFDVAFNATPTNIRRLSDMALILFWPWRINGHAEKIPANLFCYNEALARADIEINPAMVQQFEKVQARLVEIGALTPLADVPALRDKPHAPRTKLTESITTMLIIQREQAKSMAAALAKLTAAIAQMQEGRDQDAMKLERDLANFATAAEGDVKNTREAVNALAARVINLQQNLGAVHNATNSNTEELNSRLLILEGKIHQQADWLSDFSKRNMALDAKMGTVVQLLQVIAQRLNGSPTTVLATSPAVAPVQSDKLAI